MSIGKMSGPPFGRHRLGVLPGLSSRSETAVDSRGNGIATVLATVDEDSNNKQLVPLSRPQSKMVNLKGWASLKSQDSEESVSYYFQNVASRVSSLEEANKAILEEVYRLQSTVRSSDYQKKEVMKDEKRVQRELMDTIRASNDVVAQLTSRLRKAEEKLHQEKENVKNLMVHSKRLEQILFNAQKESDSQRDVSMMQAGDMKQKMDEMLRRWDKNDRMSESIIDEFHQLKNKVDIQAMEFTHLQTELKQRSKRLEDELQQTSQQARFQQDTSSIAEQNNLQLRHLLEARMAESRDAVNELRNRITQTESNGRSQVQQLSVKLTDMQAAVSDLSHRRQEEIQNMEKTRQEHHHLEENERFKLKNKIQTSVEEMNEKLMQKEVRLREEAIKKFVDVEKLFQKEESARIDFEKQLRQDNDVRWASQHKLYMEEMGALKEIRRNDRTQQIGNFKKIDDCLVMLDRKIKYERKTLEKVLLAEITKREVQAQHVVSQVEGVKEQVRVAISTLQDAIGGLQAKSARQKEQLLKEVKTSLADEQDTVSRSLRDVDARLTAISTRLTQQDETLESRMNNFKHVMQEDFNEQLRNTAEWRGVTERDIAEIREVLKEIPEELREAQERMTIFKADSETRNELEAESRTKETETIKKQIRQLSQRLEELDNEAVKEKVRHGRVETDVMAMQSSLEQMDQLAKDVKSNLASRVNSETKMRLEETSAIKRDVARLRVDVQPLLWERNSKTRSFVKAPATSLNEWGIYQCARWYDIKMRWLRLLDRSQKRKTRVLKADVGSEYPFPVSSPDRSEAERRSKSRNKEKNLENVSAFSINDGARTGSASMDPSTLEEESPLHGQPSFEDSRPDSDQTTAPKSPQPAWYNQEKIAENSRKSSAGDENGTDFQDKDRTPTEREYPDGYDDPADVAHSQEGSREDYPIINKQSGEVMSAPVDEDAGQDEERSLEASQASKDQPSENVASTKSSGKSQKSRTSIQGKSTRASPSDGETSEKPSARRRKPRLSQATPSRGKAYDMEGSR